jgi:fructokinase
MSSSEISKDGQRAPGSGALRFRLLSPSQGLLLGVDFGGTKIEIAALDGEGAILSRMRRPNPGNYDGAITVICELVAQIEEHLGAHGSVGVGVPGSISPRSGLMRNANSTWLNGRAFQQDLQKALGREVKLANDANCLALSEAVDGAAAGARAVFAVILGTGCGGGLAVDGRLVEGANGIGGEIGHNPLPWATDSEHPGPLCWCGKHGCLETWISGQGFARDFAEASGRALRAEEIVPAARAGDADAGAALDRYVDRTARALAHVANIVDPDVFVLGGGMSNVGELYERLPAQIRRYVFSDVWEGRIVAAKYGDSSGVRGAARLWSSVTT